MEVEILEATDFPEKLACTAARGDYYDGYVANTDFKELMEPVTRTGSDIQRAIKLNSAKNEFIADPVDDVGSLDDVHEPYRDQIDINSKKVALLKKLFKRGHFGPFEHPAATFAIEGVSRSCMAQITRHRHASFDVQSMRYADFSNKRAIVPKSLEEMGHFSRETGVVDVDEENLAEMQEQYRAFTDEAIDRYQEMVDNGVPKEDARFILPIGMPVNMSMTLNSRALMHVLDMRNKPDAQWEIRELSTRLFDLFSKWMPITAHLYEETGPHKLKP